MSWTGSTMILNTLEGLDAVPETHM
jgi:hypothetical protein